MIYKSTLVAPFPTPDEVKLLLSRRIMQAYPNLISLDLQSCLSNGQLHETNLSDKIN